MISLKNTSCRFAWARYHHCRAAARAAERREWVILTCAGTPGRAVGVSAAAGVDAETCSKEVEQEKWRDACRRRECRRPEGLLLTQAESEGRWRAVGVGTGASAGRRAARDAAVVSERTRGIGAGRRTCLGGGETQ
jgi:hypothetical protein